ncbi:hypothetical protein PV08_04060 [Exophiala spinifera]|uniref:Uncharacterized protein n=1 Tax=Exophiala spinifera TaxID=91928 RepID=A0A0D2BE47_9EURO|nr:uncharacterized protein PV08_04060 [Exophiala spinifera]KIW16870.1 hypothetical protein PV08_04060 [Exophiala spinifera]
MPLPSLRLLMGFTPRDLFPYDTCLERAQCTEILVEQKILIVYPFRRVTDGPIYYNVEGHIYPFDGRTTFPNILKKLCSPDKFSYEMMHYLQKYLYKRRPWFNDPWIIKGGRPMDREKGAGSLHQVSSQRCRYMILLERRKPCECHKLWKPKHNLKVVPTRKYQEDVRKGRQQEQETIEAEKAALSSTPPRATAAMPSHIPVPAYSPASDSEGWYGDYEDSGYEDSRDKEDSHLISGSTLSLNGLKAHLG